jgi:hypothetical protein
MSVYVLLALLLNRAFLGRDAYLHVLGYGPETVCMLIVLGVVVFRRPTVSSS